jgi:type 1 glutamine amidotransferase
MFQQLPNAAKVTGLAVASLVIFGTLSAAARAEPLRVLVFSKTAGFRHASIPDGIAAISQLGAQYGFDVDATEDAARFTDVGLAPYDAVVFLSTSGQVLDAEQEDAFERFIEAGNGFVGIHAASDANTQGPHFWPWYLALVGGRFRTHPAPQPAVINVVDHNHPSTRHLGATWTRTDEWYEFVDFNPDVTLLLEMDGTSYSNQGGIDGFLPNAWYHQYDGGRGWYTAGGHASEAYAEPDFRRHLAGGILWAATDVGDFNHNGVVDAADYTLWRNTLGETGFGLAADADFDEQIGRSDYELWRNHFGEVVGTAAGAAGQLPFASVPEPGPFAMLLLAAIRPLRRRSDVHMRS